MSKKQVEAMAMAAAQEELATLQFTRDEIELITGAKADETAFNRGRLKAQAEVRKAILQMAKQGSSPAQKQFLALVSGETKGKDDKEIKQLRTWANKDAEDDYKAGVLNTLRYIFDQGKNPKELY